MSLNSTISRELFKARTQHGWTQQQVAEAATISVRWYQHIEKGTHLPSTPVMLRLIILLEIDVTSFTQEVGLNATASVLSC